jgi:cytochrome d ubiquinol oxidase subunit II
MLDFSNYIDLPIIFGGIIALAILLYVILDGFDLGIGILLPFAPSSRCRNVMINSIAPFWDANETWLVMGGGGLLAAFPLAYAVLLPAFYIPIITMLMGLVLRGIAFEFRFKSEGKVRRFWGYIFHFGSLLATFCQGIILGAFVQGVKISDHDYAGGPLDWLNSFSMLTGVALIFGYTLLGSTWLIMKSDGQIQTWARKTAKYILYGVGFFLAIVCLTMPFIDQTILSRWFRFPNIIYLSPLPIITSLLFVRTWLDLKNPKADCRPFFCSIGIFLMAYLGLIISLFPFIVPFQFNIWEAAGSNEGLSLLLVGLAPGLPLVLGYNGYSYYIFRGKTNHEHLY